MKRNSTHDKEEIVHMKRNSTHEEKQYTWRNSTHEVK